MRAPEEVRRVCQQRKRAWVRFFLPLAFTAVTAAGTPAQEYELGGTITQRVIFTPRRAPIDVEGKFKVFVRGSAWLVKIVETDKSGLELRKRETGSVNGAEVFEAVLPMQTGADPPPPNHGAAVPAGANPRGPDFTQPPAATATIVSNDVPLGCMDDAMVGHLWLMFASQEYFNILTTNRLKPVYTVVIPGDNDGTRRATWELAAGPGSLPTNVTYLDDFGFTNAVYSATGITTLGRFCVPTGFVLEEHVRPGINGNTVRKRAVATVTALRPACSRSSLLPALDKPTLVTDRRLVHAQPAVKLFAYQLPTRGKWPSVAAALRLREEQSVGSRATPFILALLLGILASPAVLLFKQRGGPRSRRGRPPS